MISFAILLRKSASDCDEKSRLRPVNGLILLNLGEIALKVIWTPTCRTEANIPANIITAAKGANAGRIMERISPDNVKMMSIDNSFLCARSRKIWDISCRIASRIMGLVATRVSTIPASKAAEDSSLLKATCPSSLDSLRFFSVGTSVFS